MLNTLYFYKLNSVSFDRDYSVPDTINNAYKIDKYNTEFGTKDPFNTGIHLCMQYDIPIKLLNNYDRYKKYVKYKIKTCL